jgi:hypothetical protein
MLTEYRLGSYNNTSSSVVTNGAGAVILGLAIFRCCPLVEEHGVLAR